MLNFVLCVIIIIFFNILSSIVLYAFSFFESIGVILKPLVHIQKKIVKKKKKNPKIQKNRSSCRIKKCSHFLSQFYHTPSYAVLKCMKRHCGNVSNHNRSLARNVYFKMKNTKKKMKKYMYKLWMTEANITVT